MDKRVKIFYSQDCDGLEAQINSFLEKTAGKLHNVKFTTNAIYDCDEHEADEILFGMIIFTPEEL